MSLILYKSKEEVPEGIEVIDDNDAFFDYATFLDPSSLVQRKIVETIDQGTIVSNQTFIGRTKEFGALFKECLSTGTKTLLNISEHRDLCFDCIECGYNAIGLLSLIKDGYAIVKYLLVPLEQDSECDIIRDGKHFKSFMEVMRYERYGDYE